MKARKAPSPRLGNHPHRFLLGRRALAGHSITALLVLACPLKKKAARWARLPAK